MARIAVVLDEGFEDSEYAKPAARLEDEGNELVLIGFEKGDKVTGKRGRESAEIDIDLDEARTGDFDALMIPGGYSPDHLRTDERAVHFVKEFVESGKPVFMICHGPQLLITADVLKGRKVTGWKSIKQDIVNAGAEYVDKEVVVDGNIVSSRKPDDIPAFVDASLEMLSKRAK